MISNSNRPVIKQIAKKTFKANQNRNIVAVVAIVLTTVLFTTIFTMGFGLVNTVKEENIRKAGGDGQVVLSNITDTIYEDVKDDSSIDRIAYTKYVADEILEEKLNGLKVEMWYMDNTAIEFARYTLEEGHIPEKENEIIVSTKILEKLGIEKKIGIPIKLKYRVKENIKEEEFILAGFWESEEFSNVERIIVSEKYLEKNSIDIPYTYDSDLNYSGIVTLYINFKNEKNLENQITTMLQNAGYVWDGMGYDASAENYVTARISPAYLSTLNLSDPRVIGALFGVVLLIFITGYLIIYNIFQISVIQDIRFYGQLKTLGTTEKQIKKIVQKQVYRLAAIGIPIGLILGYVLGVILVPALMKSTEYNNTADSINLTVIPIIFISAALFSFITVHISISKPRKYASKVSPLEALKFVDNEKISKRKEKTSKHGGKIYRMALANLGRNTKRTLLVICSLTLGAVLFNSVFTLVNGFDEEKYVNNFLDKDFVISTTDYFNYGFNKSNQVVSEDFIDYVKNQPDFEDGGKLLGVKALQEQIFAENTSLSSANRDTNGFPLISLYGADDFLLQSMKVIEGFLDLAKLENGTGIVVGLIDNGTGIAENDVPVQIGEKIRFHFNKVEDEINLSETDVREFEVVAKVLIKENTYTARTTGSVNFYIPSDVFLESVNNPATISYIFDCKNDNVNIEKMQEKLEIYVSTNNTMSFDSKQTYLDAFSEIKSTFVIIGGALGTIIAFIGIVNFFNAMVTSVFARRGEFAMLQSVGMTNKQLKSMLALEGLVYACITIILSVIVSVFVSLTAIKIVSHNIWFFTFNFTLLPIVIIGPIFILISIAVPYFLCKYLAKESIIERLRAE